MKFDNYELSTIHYTIGYYIDNANLDEDENEWLNLLKEKVDSIMVSNIKYENHSDTTYLCMVCSGDTINFLKGWCRGHKQT